MWVRLERYGVVVCGGKVEGVDIAICFCGVELFEIWI